MRRSNAEPRRAGAIDIGSNTIKFTAAYVHADGRVVPIREDAQTTRLSAGRRAGEPLDPAAVDRTLAALKTMQAALRELEIDDVAAVATAGLRRASNPDAFLQRARDELGLEVRVIDGRTEAALSFAGATSGPFGEAGIVVDIGGRSTEIAVGRGGAMERFVSLDVGTISLTEDCLPSDPPPATEVEAARRAARAALGDAQPTSTEPAAEAPLIGVSGTVLALAGRQRGIADLAELFLVVEQAPLTRSEVERQLDELARIPARARVWGSVLPEGRADVIVAGAALLLETMRVYGRDQLWVTPRGLRYGMLRGAG